MPYTVYRIELDGTETVIGCADDWPEAVQMIDADKDSIDWDAGYHWHNEEGNHEGNHDTK